MICRYDPGVNPGDQRAHPDGSSTPFPIRLRYQRPRILRERDLGVHEQTTSIYRVPLEPIYAAPVHNPKRVQRVELRRQICDYRIWLLEKREQ